MYQLLYPFCVSFFPPGFSPLPPPIPNFSPVVSSFFLLTREVWGAQGLLSYPFFDPVLTDRAFLAEPVTMVGAFTLGGLVAAVFILLFSFAGIFGNAQASLYPTTCASTSSCFSLLLQLLAPGSSGGNGNRDKQQSTDVNCQPRIELQRNAMEMSRRGAERGGKRQFTEVILTGH